MLKGVNKKVVEVVDTDHEFFEKAILFIRAEKQPEDEKDLKQKAREFVSGLSYVPRRAFSPARAALVLGTLLLAACLGALAAYLLIG